MNQERVTTENTEEKAAEVTTQSETTQQPEKAIRPKGKWFGRGIYGSKDVPIRILDGLIGVLIVVIVGMIIFFAVRGGFNIVYDTDGGSEVAARKVHAVCDQRTHHSGCLRDRYEKVPGKKVMT